MATDELVPADLAEKLHRVTADADALVLENYKLLLGIAAGGLAPDGHTPEAGTKASAFAVVLRALSKLQASGIVWQGRPDFMTDDLLARLQAEAEDRRATAIKHDRYYLGYGGEVADEFSRSPQLVDFVEQHEPGMRPTGVASYLFYDEAGCGLSPHIDTEIFTLNGIIMLRQDYELEPPSALLVYSPEGAAERVLLQPGEMCLLRAGGTIHAREDVKAGETVHLVTIGFQPPE